MQAATADKTAKQRLSQLDAQLNELKKEQAELTKQWEREKVCLPCLYHSLRLFRLFVYVSILFIGFLRGTGSLILQYFRA